MKKPVKRDFIVYELVTADPEYKTHKGFVYNDHMYKEAMIKYSQFLRNENPS